MKDTNEISRQRENPYTVGIVGMGPKGFYGLERLVAQIYDLELNCPVDIHVFNQNGFFGAGDIYRCDQPSYLIMNYSNRNIDIWTKEVPLANLEDTLNFTEWLSLKSGIGPNQIEEGFASRAMVGSYFMEGFTKLCANLPEHIRIKPHVAVVTDLVRGKGGYTLVTRQKTFKPPITFQKLLLTTGHSWNGAKFEKAQSTSPFINFIYPIDKKLSDVTRNSNVAIKGLGLTFIDTVLGLTEGRGGLFKKKSDGGYIYVSSGNEPKKIFPFSRTGLPMIPRNGEADEKVSPYYLNEEMLKDSLLQPPVNFEKSILPLIKKEFLFNYYRVLFRNRDRELLHSVDFTKVQNQIDKYHKSFPEDEKFDWVGFENPFESIANLTHENVLVFYKELLSHSELGLHRSPMIAAVSSWRRISDVFNRVYSYGGLDATSHQKFDKYYFGLFNRLSYGPPVENVKKVLALAECGILKFDFVKNPEVTFLKQSNTFRINSRETPISIAIDFLIDARIPKGCPRNKGSDLFSNLLNRGVVRYFENADDVTYVSGGVDIDYKGRALDRDGNINNDITFYGTPTEGITLDNDTLSRKRNNFASQWSFDVALDIKQQSQKNFKDEREYKIL